MNLRRNAGVQEAEIERETERRDAIGKGEVVHGTEIERGVIEENVPKGIETARENGISLNQIQQIILSKSV